MYTLKPENYVIGIVAANQDEEPRKGWDTMFQSLKIFADNNPDVQKNLVIFLHTDPKNEKGRNLVELSHEIGIDKYIIWNDAYISSIVGLPENALAKLYNTFDVFLMLSRREGFCLPVLEAQACGVPCIVNDFSALNERVDNGRVGWLCKPAAKVYSNLNGITSIPDAYKGADALTEAYNSPSKREAFAKKGIEYAKTQTWEIAVDKYWMPFLRKIWDDIQENRKKAVETKKIEDEKAWKEKAKETTKEEQKPTS
jgi:glycosyltransferase involved in cell wall biosynthesis